jgi:HlyD family secretion protein
VSILPFVALAADPTFTSSNVYLTEIHRWLGEPPHREFLIIVGVVFISFMVIANLIMVISQFLMNRYSFRIGGEISSRLYGYYLSKDILFHAETNSALLVQRIMRDSIMLSSLLIAPALKANSRIFSIILLSGMLLFVNPVVALNTVLALGFAYFFIFHLVKKAIHDNGIKISILGKKRNQTLNESFGGIRDLKLYSFENEYLARYRKDTKVSDRALADNMIIGESPYYIVETILFAGMVLMTLFFYSSENGLNTALPLLTLYCLAGVKIIPKVQQCYLALTRIRSAQPVFKRLYQDMLSSGQVMPFGEQTISPLRPRSTVEIRDMSFSYDRDDAALFENFCESFEVGKITAITGGSGAGKTTLLEIMMGLVRPMSGHIVVDGVPLTENDIPNWRAAIGYVSQDVYLMDNSVAENIAFGQAEDEMDFDRVVWAAKQAEVHDVIEALPEGYWTTIGEQGSLLSGGQRQRIGIARALYRKVPFLFLDEATSALDTGTQNRILKRLVGLKPEITVVMITHRVESLAVVDRVVRLDPGADPR